MKALARLLVVGWIAVVLAGCGEEAITIDTPDGPLRGKTNGRTHRVMGVPYARAPVGALRFAPPERVVPWTETFDATRAKPGCAQLEMGSLDFDETSSEDCLYLNVWAPARSGSFPVMVWIPGGGYVIGAGTESQYDGHHLSEQHDVVVVTINYRLASFGFLNHSALRSEEGSTGNFGLLDQREAFEWVRRNISSFHGDPANVTIFGESAGGGSVCVHLTSPGSAGLFQRAILESAPCTLFDLPTQAEAEAQADELSVVLGCEGSPSEVIECLRAAPTKDVLRALPPNEKLVYGAGVAWWPVVDGTIIEQQPAVLLASGASADVPIIVGANSDEGTAFFGDANAVLDLDEIRAILAEFFRDGDIDVILDFYGGGSMPREVAGRVLSEMFICDARRIARLHTAAGRTAYQYHFTFGFYDDIIGAGAFHTAEIPFVFGNALGFPIPPAGIPLKNAVQGYWTRFADSGDPNGGGRPDWPAYTEAEDLSIQLDLSVSRGHGVRREACDFWDNLRLPEP